MSALNMKTNRPTNPWTPGTPWTPNITYDETSAPTEDTLARTLRLRLQNRRGQYCVRHTVAYMARQGRKGL